MGRGRRDQVYLTVEQKDNLETIARNGYGLAKTILHARILKQVRRSRYNHKNLEG